MSDPGGDGERPAASEADGTAARAEDGPDVNADDGAVAAEGDGNVVGDAVDLAVYPDDGPVAWEGDGPGACAAAEKARLTAWVRGRVQGVGFRWWVRSRALELGLVGIAENLTDGRVKVVAEGDHDGCAALLDRLEGTEVPGRVAQVTFRWDQARGGLDGFVER